MFSPKYGSLIHGVSPILMCVYLYIFPRPFGSVFCILFAARALVQCYFVVFMWGFLRSMLHEKIFLLFDGIMFHFHRLWFILLFILIRGTAH